MKETAKYPKRIVSLVPSITELLFYLDLDERIKGITKYCIHPKNKVQNKTIIGGIENIDFNIIDTINPDLIFVNKEENSKEEVQKLSEKYKCNVSDIKSFIDAVELIFDIGQITGKQENANKLIKQILEKFKTLNTYLLPKTVAYIIWKDPFMTINKDTFINNMLIKAGFENIFKNKLKPYPTIDIEEIKSYKPDVIFLSSEPYHFNETNKKEFEKMLPNTKIKLVDGEMFSWYGSHILKAADYFKQLC